MDAPLCHRKQIRLRQVVDMFDAGGYCHANA